MGQKVNPIGIRLGYVKDWNSKWYADNKNYPLNLKDDMRVRQFLTAKLNDAGISSIYIERLADKIHVTIYAARPGIVIGRKGGGVEDLRAELSALLRISVHLSISEVKKPELDAKLVADSVAQQLEKRVMFRRAMKRAVSSALRLGALGVKISVGGRLAGADIARTEWYKEGRVPLHTFRADIDYATARANTTYGVIGVKVWIFKGEVNPLSRGEKAEVKAQKAGGAE